MTADLEFTVGEFGEALEIPLVDSSTGAPLNTAGYTAATLTIADKDDYTTIIKSIPLIVLTGAVRWVMNSGDTDIIAGNYAGQIELTGPGLEKKTFLMSIYAGVSLV